MEIERKPIRSKFAEALRKFRLNRGYSMDAFARRIGYSGSQSYARIESDVSGYGMSVDRLIYLLKAFPLTEAEAKELCTNYSPKQKLVVSRTSITDPDGFDLLSLMASRVEFLSVAEQCAFESLLHRNIKRCHRKGAGVCQESSSLQTQSTKK